VTGEAALPQDRVAALAAGVIAGDRLALARAITLAESGLDADRAAAEALLERLLPRTGGAIRLGISGPPGVGKSTFIETLGLHLVAQGRRVAVLAVDPSSKISGGAILGDKTRMGGLALAEQAFIRPSPAGGAAGGVAPRTREAILLCEAAGYDVVIVETVGVGQSESAVADMVDLLVLLIQPAGGDELQGMKRGILELADLVLVNKADGALADAARRTLADYRHALRLLAPAGAGGGPLVEACSALTGAGVAEAWTALAARHAALAEGGGLAARRQAQARRWLRSELELGLLAALAADPAVAAGLKDCQSRILAGNMTPPAAARRLLAAFLKRARAPADGPPS
jgi:LAO/AO transport system kinase